MSGYLHGLVARARGATVPGASTPRPRRQPRFPPSTAWATDEIAAAVEREAAPRAAMDASTKPIAPLTEPALSPPPGHAPEIVVREARPIVAPRDGASTADRVTARQLAPDGLRPPAVALRAQPGPTSAATEIVDAGSPGAWRDDAPAAPDARPAARLRPSPSPAATPSGAPIEPRIEVHIGRVEVRRPAAPEPPAWSRQNTAPDRSAPRGFGELAAARRYVDRLGR